MVLKEPTIFGSFLPLLVDGLERRLLLVSQSRVLKELSDCAFLAIVLKEVDKWF